MDINNECQIITAHVDLVQQAISDDTFTPMNMRVNAVTNRSITIEKDKDARPFSIQQRNVYQLAPTFAVKYLESVGCITSVIAIIFKLNSEDDRTIKVTVVLSRLYSTCGMIRFAEIVRPHLYELVRECVLYSDEMLADGKHPADRFIELLEELLNEEERRAEEPAESST